VTVNLTNTAQLYGDWTFAATNFPILSSYSAVAKDKLGRVSTNTVNVNLSTDNTAYVYDGNGNLLYDGTRTFAWDNENELIQVLVSNQWLSQFSYDGKMRRRIRHEYTWQSGQWVQTNAVYYVYDGNEVIQERAANNTPTTTYTRGLDLSSSLEGAGGIGGLLAMTLNSALGPTSSNSYYYHSDGNGNVTMLLNGSQYIVAKYLYDAFGNVLSAAGSMAAQNLYRFSSKEAHVNSGLVYYLYRYYDPNLQRWLNRDPIDEKGFELLSQTGSSIVAAASTYFVFVDNDSIDHYDSFGLLVLAPPAPPIVIVTAPIEVGFCTYEAGKWVCQKTGFTDWLANKLCRTKEKTFSTERCDKTRDSVDPATGRRFCTYKCTKSGTHNQEGTGCDRQTFYRVVPE
jgi:RHS repeat-associated protein